MFSVFLKKQEKYLPIILLSMGILLRFVSLGSMPEGCEQDEAYAAWNAFSLYHEGIDSAGQSFPVYFEAWGHGQSAMLTYMMLPFIALLRGHVTLLAIRLPQALTAVFTLAAVYFLIREMYNVRTACWALFLMAICPWHVMISRWGLDANLAPGFLMFGLCFFVYGLRRPPLLVLSAVFYGLCLYCYALTWIIVPVLLVLQGLYCFRHKRLRLTKWVLIAVLCVGIIAFPLIAFLLVNNGYLPAFHIGPFSVYRMSALRQNEFSLNIADIIENIKTTLKLFYHQSGPYVYDAISPFGFFYRIGRIFVLIGLSVLLFRVGRAFAARAFSYDFLIFAQLIGAGVIGMLVCVDTTRINCAFIPLVLCEAIGIASLTSLLHKKSRRAGMAAAALIACLYLWELIGFQTAYYTEYREASSGWFYKGADEAVKTACRAAAETGRDIYVQTGLHYPNILLTMETTAGEYLESVVYSEFPPAPSEFSVDGVRIHMGIDKENITTENVYIFIEPDRDRFHEFEVEQFTHWYVAY